MIAIPTITASPADAKHMHTPYTGGAAAAQNKGPGGGGRGVGGGLPRQQSPVVAKLTSLSMREKALIVGLLAIALISAFIVLIYIPSMERATQLQDEVQALQDQKVTTQLAIADLNPALAAVAAETQRMESSLDKYGAPMKPEKIDETITSLLEECGFTPRTLTMRFEGAAEIPVFSAPPLTMDTSALWPATADEEDAEGEEGEDAEGEDAAAEPEPAPATALAADGEAMDGVYAVYVVTATTEGDLCSLYELLDTVVPHGWMKLVGFTYEPGLVGTSWAYWHDDIPADTFTFTFKIYILTRDFKSEVQGL